MNSQNTAVHIVGRGYTHSRVVSGGRVLLHVRAFKPTTQNTHARNAQCSGATPSKRKHNDNTGCRAA